MRKAVAALPEPNACDDRTLADLARQGDEAAIRAIVQRHNRRLFRVARAVLHDDAEAEDVVQETYCRAFANLDSFRGTASLPTWLTRIALNEALGRRRKRRVREAHATAVASEEREGARLIVFPASAPPTGPESDLARSQIRAMLEQAVSELPQAFRIVFVLRAIEEMEPDEVASQLGIRPETVKTRLHRARRLLRESLDRQAASAFSELFPFDGARCSRMADRVVAALQRRGLMQ